jgi:hypothetical protein
MLKASVAAYLSGSRVLIEEPLSAELALTFSLVIAVFALLFAFTFAFAFEFVFFGGTHASASRAMAAMVPNPKKYLTSRINIPLVSVSCVTLRMNELKGNESRIAQNARGARASLRA